MKDFSPEGWTRQPKPVSLSSQAIHDFSAGSRASTARLVRESLTLAVRFPVLMLVSIAPAPWISNTVINTRNGTLAYSLVAHCPYVDA
jgi:hypothetical protein